MGGGESSAKLIDDLYASVLDPTLQRGIARDVLAAVGGAGFNWFDSRPGTDETGFRAFIGDDRAIPDYLGHFRFVDGWNCEARRCRSGSVLLMNEDETRLRLGRTEFFNDFLRPVDNVAVCSVVIDPRPATVSHFAVYRHAGDPPFGGRERQFLQRLSPHLLRWRQLSRELEPQVEAARHLERALELMPSAVMVVDEGLRLLLTNEAAEAIVREDDGLAFRGGRLSCRSPSAQERLTALVGRATRGEGEPAASGAMAIARRSGRASLALLVCPLGRGAAAGVCGRSRSPCAMLLLNDPSRRARPPEGLLAELLGLTPAEGRVALALYEGESVSEISDRLRISENTARTHVRRILGKTGDRRQGQLIGRLARMLGPIA